MLERIGARGRHVLVDREIARRVEQRVRIAAFVPAMRLVMRERVDPGVKHVRIAGHIVDGVEQGVAVVHMDGAVVELQVLDVAQRERLAGRGDHDLAPPRSVTG